jgi:hypothetical protein
MDIDKGLKKLVANLKKLEKTELQVGIFDSEIAECAAYNEYGTTSKLGNKHIPARPFMAMSFNEKDGWKKEIDDTIDAISWGEDTMRIIAMLGEIAVNDIKLKISDNIPPPNAESTKKQKGSDRTLIDTGAMRNAVTYKIVRKYA